MKFRRVRLPKIRRRSTGTMIRTGFNALVWLVWMSMMAEARSALSMEVMETPNFRDAARSLSAW